MKCCSRWMWLGLIPAVVAAGLMAGCGGGGSSGSSAAGSSDGKSDNSDAGSGSHSRGKRTAFKSDGRGTISGRVVATDVNFDELKAKNEKFAAQMKAKDDFKGCITEGHEMDDPTWVVSSADKGLKNVVVWVNPPKGEYFKLDETDLTPDKGSWSDKVTLDQPHCAFIKHVTLLFPQYYNESKGKYVSTGQKFFVTNESSLSHNTNIKKAGSNDSLVNPQIPSKSQEEIKGITPNQTKPYKVGCNVHNWMSGYIWAFEHPFAAVTDDHGNFTIKNVPAGSDLHLMVWHEKGGMIKDGEKIKLEKGKEMKLDEMSVKFTD